MATLPGFSFGQAVRRNQLFSLADLTSRVLTGKQELSCSERNRLSRNLYRFQIYCHLFGDRESPPLSVVNQRDKYFAHFAPWENEQLACIHDYLFEFVDLGMISSSLTSHPSQTKLNSIRRSERKCAEMGRSSCNRAQRNR